MMDCVSQGSIRKRSSVLGIRRQTYYRRKQGHRSEEIDQHIGKLLREATQTFIAWGFWLIFYYLRNQGYSWNHKRVYRVWKQENLHLRMVPKRKKLKRKYQDLLAPTQINQGWSVDFLSDWVVEPNQQKVRVINVMDDCSRKALWTEAHKSITAKKLVTVLNYLIEWRGKPAYIRCDNGPEFISKKLEEWALKNQIEIRFIQPGKPSQNGLIERLNGTLRTECLNLEWFDSIEKLNEKLQNWWMIYNQLRPHSSIGYKTPNQFEKDKSNFYFRVVAA